MYSSPNWVNSSAVSVVPPKECMAAAAKAPKASRSDR